MEIANDADADEASVRRETARAHFVYGEALFRGAQAQNTVFGEQVRANAEASGTRLEDAPEDEDVGEEDEEEERARRRARRTVRKPRMTRTRARRMRKSLIWSWRGRCWRRRA